MKDIIYPSAAAVEKKLYTNTNSAGTNSTSPFRNNKGTMVNRLIPLVDYYFSYSLGFIFHKYEMARIRIKTIKNRDSFLFTIVEHQQF